ncbi:MAG: Na+/H+ antiporter subunit G [Rubrivivax sp.]|nr:Na+/H+ antiporter subunit G [Rubrivivax sp.]
MNTALSTLPVWLDILLALLVVVGTAFALVGSWGLAKLSDFFKRLHGPTKATTLGVGCVLIASGLWFSIARGAPSLHELLITLFLFLTAPVSAHLLVKAALRVASPAERPPLPPVPKAPAGAGSGPPRRPSS